MCPLPDDGIPVLTEVVDAALLPQPEPGEPALPDLPEGPPSLSMFPELDGSPHPGAAATAEIVAWPVGHEAEGPAADWLSADDPQPAATDPLEDALAGAPTAPAAAPVLAEAADTHDFGRPHGESSAPTPQPAWPGAGTADQAHDFQPAPAATTGHDDATPSPPGPGEESRSELETRIFEALAARMERLVDERIEAVLPGVVDAAFSGIKAGLAATLRAGVREAVEQAVRDEYERRRDGD